VHDSQLAENPELLQAAGAVTLLALENSELDAAWRGSLRELAASRRRITSASDRERRKLEHDLHDGAQQRLLAALLRVASAGELVSDNPDLTIRLQQAEADLEGAIGELRDLAHGIYPTTLAARGLADALRLLPARFPGTVSVTEVSERRFPPEVEAAMYYCCLEAVQNASKHAGPGARISIRMRADPGDVHLDVRDDGRGFDASDAGDGLGLQSMRDRLGAIGGHIDILSESGRGTVIAAAAPLGDPHALGS
jgi:signal transduction histidine kinase